MDPEPEQQASTGGGASTPPPQPAQGPGPSEGVDSGTMSQDAEVDMKDVELNELEPEKQPMNAAAGSAGSAVGPGSAEKNGLVKIKVAEDEAEAAAASKFTGLTKEELLKVASSPGWVRTRWALLVLFWLGWLGMLAGAVVIIVQAPRCRELPALQWWHQGALYRIGDVKAFLGSEKAGVAGLKEQLDYLNSLKVKGIVLGPIHKNPLNDFKETNLTEIDPSLGSQEDLESFLQLAKKKNIRVILDLTPNYKGQNSWFQLLDADADVVTFKVKDALSFWLNAGVDGFQFLDVEAIENAPSVLAEWQNITKSFKEDRLLIAGTNSSDLRQILNLLSVDNNLLLTSSYLASANPPQDTYQHAYHRVFECHEQPLVQLECELCSDWLSQARLMTSILPASLLRLYQMLLFTLPGTPVFTYGDEIGLEAAVLPGQPMKSPVMLWNESSAETITSSMTVKGQNGVPGSLLTLFQKLSEHRTKERSLLHGDFYALSSDSSGPDLFFYIRQWDQNRRFLVLLNFGDKSQSFRLGTFRLPAGVSLPTSANLVLSTHEGHKEETSLELNQLDLKPHEGLLLHFPHVA